MLPFQLRKQLQGEQMSVCPSVRLSVRLSVRHNIFLMQLTAKIATVHAS